jgi:RND family efflux transporter MFP subunit
MRDEDPAEFRCRRSEGASSFRRPAELGMLEPRGLCLPNPCGVKVMAEGRKAQGTRVLLTSTSNARGQKPIEGSTKSPQAILDDAHQSADATAGDAAAKKAALASAEANVARFSDLESFKRVLAPFDGVVTSRNTDIGTLINAGQGSALFRVADTSKLRVYVLVPQLFAANTTPGLDAEVIFPERPGKTYPAQVVRTAEALDPNSRTLQVELLVDNASGVLFPGAYAQVHFKLPRGTESLRVPANTVLFRSTDLQVAVVGPDDRVTLKNITTGRDFGAALEVLNGLGVDDNLVVNPPDSLATGTRVRVVQSPSPPRDL